MNRVLTFFENSGFLLEDGRLSTDLKQLGRGSSFALSLNDLRVNTGTSLLAPFTVTQRTIRANELVGAFSIAGIQVEILPKIAKPGTSAFERRSQAFGNLVKILSYSSFGNVWDQGFAPQREGASTIIELLISIFARNVRRYIRDGMKSEYLKITESSETVRGRLEFTSSNFPPKAFIRPLCSWDEYRVDTELNRSIAYMLRLFRKQGVSTSVVHDLEDLGRQMGNVGVPALFPHVFNVIPGARISEHLRSACLVARLFLRQLGPDTFGNGTENIIVAFNMANLFEAYFLSLIVRNKNALGVARVLGQKGKRLISGYQDLDGDFTEGLLRNTYSDILIECTDGTRIVVDTKYKQLEDENRTLGIKNADIYQISTYQSLHANASDLPRALLIYPQNETKIRRSFKLNFDKERWIGVSTFDLESYAGNEHKVVSDLKELLRAAV